MQEIAERVAETGKRLQRVLAVPKGDLCLFGGLVVLGWLVEQQVKILFREEGEVRAFVLWTSDKQ